MAESSREPLLRKYAYESVKNRFQDVQDAVLCHLGVRHIDDWTMVRLIRGLRFQRFIKRVKLQGAMSWLSHRLDLQDVFENPIELHNHHMIVRRRLERAPTKVDLPHKLEDWKAVYFKVNICTTGSANKEAFPRGLEGFTLKSVDDDKLVDFMPIQVDSRGNWTGWVLRGTTFRGKLSRTVPMALEPNANPDGKARYFAWSDPLELDQEELGKVSPPDLVQFFKYGGFMDFTSGFQWVNACFKWSRKLQWVGAAIPVTSGTPKDEPFLALAAPIRVPFVHVCKQWSHRKRVPSDELKAAGAEFFWYVAPGDMLGEETSPLSFPDGGFLFIGKFPDTVLPDEGRDRLEEDTARWWAGHVSLLKRTIKRNRVLEDKVLNKLENISLNDEKKVVLKPNSEPLETKEILTFLRKARFVFRLHDERLLLSNLYFGVFWFRFPFMFLMITLLMISAFSGALMQVMFCVYGDIYDTLHGTNATKEFVVFGMLPLLMVCCAVLVHKLWDLIFASFSPPYFVDFRARLLTIFYVLGAHDKFAPSKLSCWAVDLYFLVGFEILPVLGALYNAVILNVDYDLPHFFYLGHLGQCDTIWGGFVTGMIYNCAVMVIIYIAADVGYCALERRVTPERSLRFVLDKIIDVVETHRIHPMSMGYQCPAFDNIFDSRVLESQTDHVETLASGVESGRLSIHSQLSNKTEEESDSEHSQIPIPNKTEEGSDPEHHHQAYCLNRYHLKRYHASPGYHRNLLWWWTPWVVTVFFLWLGAGSGFHMLQSAGMPLLAELPWLLTGVPLIMAIFSISDWLTNRFPPLTGSTFRVSLFLFCLIQAVLFSYGFQYHTSRHIADRLKPVMIVNGSCHRTSTCSWSDPGEAQPYPVCQQSWGNPTSSVTALDLAALSWIAYEQNESHIRQLLAQSFGPGPQLEHVADYSKTPRWLAVRFPPGWKEQAASGTARREGTDTLVVAVKGTSTVKDGYLDTDLFTMIKILQLFKFIAPVLNVIPVDFVQWMVKMVKLWAGGGGSKEMMIWDGMQQHMKDLQEAERTRQNGTKFVLTGHSLGGTIAKIVAAKQDIPALVWSAPGTRYSQAYFSGNDTGSVSEERMQRNTFVVMPDNDAVPRVDEQQSVVQRIQCFQKHHMPVNYFTGTAECHMIQKSACEVWRVCGDPMQRDFNETCHKFVAQDERGKLYPFLSHPILDPKIEQ